MSSIWSFLRSNTYKDRKQPINLPWRKSEHSEYEYRSVTENVIVQWKLNPAQLEAEDRSPCDSALFFSNLASLHSDEWGAVNGLHDGSQAAAQIVGRFPHFGGLLQDHPFCRTVQDSGQEFTELFLNRIWLSKKQTWTTTWAKNPIEMVYIWNLGEKSPPSMSCPR